MKERKAELRTVKIFKGCHILLPTALDGKKEDDKENTKHENEEDKRENANEKEEEKEKKSQKEEEEEEKEKEKEKEEVKKRTDKGKEQENDEDEFCFSVPGIAIAVPSPGHSLFYGIYRQKLRDARNEIEPRNKRKYPLQPQTER